MGKKTRFVVGMDGGERELFSVEENSRGGLTITLPLDPPTSVLHVRRLEHRFSVHESRESQDGGFLIKETVRDSDGTTEYWYAYVRPKEEHALLPAFSRLCASLRNSPDSSAKKRKTTIVVQPNHVGGPFFFIVTVSRSSIAKAKFPRCTQLTCHKFREFFIYVTSGAFPGTAMNRFVTITTLTSGPTINGIRHERTANFDIPQAVSPTPDQLAFFIEGNIIQLSRTLWELYLKTPWDRDPQPSFIERLEMAKAADVFKPEADSPEGQSAEARLRHWRANPPADLFIHPENAEVIYTPVASENQFD